VLLLRRVYNNWVLYKHQRHPEHHRHPASPQKIYQTWTVKLLLLPESPKRLVISSVGRRFQILTKAFIGIKLLIDSQLQ
jgi:hypothetical protein